LFVSRGWLGQVSCVRTVLGPLISLSCLGVKDPLLAGSFSFERKSKSVPVLQQPVGTSFGSVPVTNVQKQGGLVPVPKG
jgi:hypothetical protein